MMDRNEIRLAVKIILPLGRECGCSAIEIVELLKFLITQNAKKK